MNYNIRNIASFLLNGGLPALSGMILFKVYSENFSIEDVGLISLLLALSPLFLSVFSLQMSASINRFYFIFDEDSLKQSIVVTNAIFLNFVSFGVVFLISYIFFLTFKGFCSGRLFDHPNALVVIFLLSFSNSLVAIFNSILVVTERGSEVLSRTVLVSLFQVVLISYLIIYHKIDLVELLVLILFFSVVTLILTFLQFNKYMQLSWIIDFNILMNQLKYSFPLVFHQIGGYLFNFSSIIVLSYMSGLSQVALLSLLFKFTSVVKIAVNSLNTAWQPSAFRFLSGHEGFDENYIKKSFLDFLKIILVGMIFFDGIIKFCISNYFSHEYHVVLVYVPLLLSSYLFRLLYVFVSTKYFFNRKTNLITKVTLFCGFLNVLITSLLIYIYNFGFSAAVYSFYVTMFVYSLIYVSFIYYDYNDNFFKELFLIFLLSLFLHFMVYENFGWGAVALKFLIVFYFLKTSNITKQLFNQIMRKR